MQTRLGVLTLLLAAGLAAPATAVEEPEVLRLRAERLVDAGRCEDALPLLARVRAARPEDARAAHASGLCALKLRRWAAAAEALGAASRLDPTLPGLHLQLGIARFHAGDFAGAGEALASARASGVRSAELELYSGLLALRETRDPEAVAAFERARRLDALAVEPLASYYEAQALTRMREVERAREALARAQAADPESPWAAEAAQALARASRTRGLAARRDVEGLQQAERPLGSLVDPSASPLRSWASLSLGVEYDDNVVLRGSGVELPSDISDEGDERLVGTAEIGSELFRGDDWSGGVFAAWYGSAHADLESFNAQFPTLSGWLDRQLGERTTARLQADAGYAWLDADPYLAQLTLTPALFHTWGGEAGTTRVYAEYVRNDFLFSTSAITAALPSASERDLNRDGDGFAIGLDHALPLGERLAVRAGYRYRHYGARGSEYSFNSHEALLGARLRLPLELVLDAEGSWTWKPYRHASVFPDPSSGLVSGLARREDVWQVDVILQRALTEWLTASLRYGHLDNDSNVAVYDYDRDVVGAYLTVRFRR